MTATGQTEDRDEVTFTDDEIDAILNGEVVEKDGHTFSNTGVWDEHNADWHSPNSRWRKLRDGEQERILWSDVVGTYADGEDDDDVFTEYDKELIAEAQQEVTTVADDEGEDAPIPTPSDPLEELNTEPQGEMTTVADEDREVIRMEHTIDASEMSPKDREAIGELADLYEDCFAEVVAKNRDYSWSFLRTGQKLADTPATEFDDPVRAQVFGLLTRVGDKRERLTENVYGNGDASVSDDPATTAMEAANYYLFIAFALGNPELARSL